MQAENTDVEASTGPSSLTVSARSAKRCPACKSDLSTPGLDVQSGAYERYSFQKSKECLEGVVAVIEDARKRYLLVNEELSMVNLEPVGGTKYSLSFRGLWIVMHHGGSITGGLGSIIVSLKGQSYLSYSRGISDDLIRINNTTTSTDL
jgi:hypothetical protein